MSDFVVLPEQKIPDSKKTKEWKEQCVNSIVGYSNNTMNFKRRSASEKQINYDLVNGIINEIDFNYVIDPFNLGTEYGNQPAKLECYPLIQTKLSTLQGEELKRRFRYRAVCTGGIGQEVREEMKAKYLQRYFENQVYEELGIDITQPLPEDFKEPEQIKQFFDFKYEELGEVYANRILKQLENTEQLKHKFNKGFKHATIVAEEIYRVSKVNDKPHLRVVDPRYFTYIKSDESDFIEDSFLVKEEREMTTSEIIDEFREYLTDDIISKIEAGRVNVSGSTYAQQAALTNVYNTNSNSQFNIRKKPNLITVYQVEWKSMRKFYFLHYVDEKGNKQIETITDETFKLTDKQKKNPDNYLEEQWLTEVWKGTRIGSDIYVDINPAENQLDGKLSYIGAVYNDLNSIPTSLVDYMKVYQHTYNVLWYRFKLEVAKAQGKKILMDIAQIPRSHGFSTEKWMYHFQNMNIVWINSAEEGQNGQPPSNSFNQFKEFDLSLSQSIIGYMNYMNKIEMMIGQIVGISPQRESQVSPYETSSGIQQAIQTSSTITEPFFYLHDIVKRNVLSYLVQFSRYCYKESRNKKMSFLNSDLIKEIFEVDTDLMFLSEYGVFIADNTQDDIIFDVIKQNAQAALSSQLITFSELIEIFKSNSVAEITHILKDGEERREQLSQQQSQMNQQIEKAKIEAAADKDFKDKQFELLKQQKEIDGKIQLKELELEGKFVELNQGPSYDEVHTNSIKREEIAQKSDMHREQQLNENIRKNTDSLIKLQELEIKDKDIDTKLQIAKTNKNRFDSKSKK